MKKLGILLVLFVSLSACNKSDFAYSEKVTHDFLSNREKLENFHQEVLDGKFINQSETAKHFSETSANNFIQISQSTVKDINELKHSGAADAFHAKVIEYLSTLSDSYYPEAKKYILANDTSSEKETALQNLKTIKEKLSTLEDEALTEQEKFFKEVNIQAK